MADTQYDPADHTVDEVTTYLQTASQEERDRVIAAEQDGKARVTILNWTESTVEEPAAQEAQVEQVVKYVGGADERSISAADWRSIDVQDQDKVVWNARNRHQVRVSELSKGALDYLATDSGFKLQDA